ncbi:MAG: PAS domain S-box protein [Chryseosolibacter sp.]
MMGRSDSDGRLAAILQQVNGFARRDLGRPLPVSEAMDELDAICTGLNRLRETLRAREESEITKEARIEHLLEVLLRYTMLDFSSRAPVDGNGDEIDALAAGLNAMGEEVIYHMDKQKDSEAQVQAIFNNAPDAVVVIDSNDVIVQWNPAASKIFGWTASEVTGKLLHTILVPEAYRQLHLDGMQRFIQTGKGRIIQHTVEYPALRKNGSDIPVELTISPAKLNDKHLFIAFLRDVTRRKKNEEQIRQLNAALEQRVQEKTEQYNATERKYRQLFENNPMPLWVLDMETLRFMDVNESALKQYGYTREEFLSMTSPELRPEEERARYLKLGRTVTGTQNVGVWKHLKKDGTIIHCEIIVHEMIFEGRQARLVLSHDVTDKARARQALELSEARFRRIFDSKMTGFFFWDDHGKITDANDLFLEMVGFTRADIQNGAINLHEITPAEYREAEMEAIEQIRREGVCDPFEKEYLRKDGTRLPVLIGAANVNEDGQIKGVTCVMDISQRKKMEQEILELNRTLELRISERTHALEAANKELESFSYSVSHDLRAPLRAIHGYSQMLSEDYQASLDQEGIRLLNAVKFNARRMGQLVDDLLAFSRLGKRTMSFSDVDLSMLVQEVLKDFPAEEEHAKVTVHTMGTAYADASLLRQAFQNLISNAFKYSSKKEHPEIEIGSETINGVRAYYVRDNGAGFDMAYYQKLFGVFQRLHGQEEFEGTGVGLAIVQRIVHRHGGAIWAESRVDEGAAFYFTLTSASARINDSRSQTDFGLSSH